jgi:hypothetical protein
MGSRISASKANISSGKEKVKVLPDPVKAMPIISRPDNLGKEIHVSFPLYR